MNWEKLRRQLAREAYEYMADLRALKEGLKSAEGWIALGLFVAALIIMVVWAVVSIGFSPPNEEMQVFMRKMGIRECRPVSNFSGVLIFVDMFMMLFLTAITLGNVLNVIARVKRGYPREPRDLIISSVMMLTVGIGGIIYMILIC